MLEEWKDIPGYEGYYQVSNMGRVKRLYREDIIHNYGGLKSVPEKILNLDISYRSYKGVRVTLSKLGKTKRFTVSRIVASVFIENKDNLPIVEHIDDDPTNNRVDNLKWGTHKSNSRAREDSPKNKKYRIDRITRLQKSVLTLRP
jgi:hypothetical protein